MVRTQCKSWMAGVFACGLSSVAMAGTTASAGQSQDVQAQIEALKAQVAQLQQQQGENWLNDRRKAEVKSLVRDVLKDADTRTSMLNEGMTAGYDGHHFFLGSADGDFKLAIEGQFDFRYIFNNARGNDNRNVQGFQLRRAKLAFAGNIYGKQLTYKILGSFDRNSGAAILEDGWADYNFGNGFDVKFGQYTTPFLREYMISSSAQQAVERSMVTQYFGEEFTKGVTGTYKADKFRLIGMVSGGPGKRNTDFNNNTYEYGLIGRGEYLAAGNWKEFGDYQAWSGEPVGLLLGGAAQYDAGANGGGLHKADLLKFTADVSAKFGNGLNAYAAFYGQHYSPRNDAVVASGEPNGTQLGFLVQAGQFIIPDKMDVFARYEYANLKGGIVSNGSASSSANSNDKLSLITVGTNWYMHKHNAKFTLDGVYALQPVPISNGGAGILSDAKKGEFALRAQFQLKF